MKWIAHLKSSTSSDGRFCPSDDVPGDREVLRYASDEADVRASERKIKRSGPRSGRSGQWLPRPSRLCDWCDHSGAVLPGVRRHTTADVPSPERGEINAGHNLDIRSIDNYRVVGEKRENRRFIGLK